MNNRGFSIVYIMIFAIFAIAAVFAFYSFISGLLFASPSYHAPNYKNEYTMYYRNGTLVSSNNLNKYNYLESKAEMAASKYVSDNYTFIYENTPMYINLSTLIANKYIGNMVDINDNKTTCSGYVEVINIKGSYNYNGYIRCGNNYSTSGYMSYLDY